MFIVLRVICFINIVLRGVPPGISMPCFGSLLISIIQTYYVYVKVTLAKNDRIRVIYDRDYPEPKPGPPALTCPRAFGSF
jgi:hypothetical protein